MNLPVKSNAASLLMDPDSFNHMQRVGQMLANASLFPDHLRRGTPEQAIANGVLVLNMASRLNEDPLTVAQNIYFVNNKPGWSTSYMIGKANQHGVFKNPISWELKGTGDDLSVTAFGELSSTGQRVEATCSMAMACAEGWTKNAKYKSMPEQMLRYRSAAFLIRLYCPEVMIGVPAQIEVEMGMKDVTPSDAAFQTQTAQPVKDTPKDAETIDATAKVVEPEKGKTASKKASEEPKKEEPKKEEPKQPAETQAEKVANGDHTPDISQFENLKDMILNDCNDEDVDIVVGFYAEQLEQMKKFAPSVHEDLQAELKKFHEAKANPEGAA